MTSQISGFKIVKSVGFKGKTDTFLFKKNMCEKMEFLIENLIKSEGFENRIKTLCSFNNVKCDFRQGRILTIKNTNISFIEPHKIDITIKDKKILIIYFDKDNVFLYSRRIPISIKKLDILIKEIKNMV